MFWDSWFLLGKNLRRLWIGNRRQKGKLKLRELFLVPQIFTDTIEKGSICHDERVAYRPFGCIVSGMLRINFLLLFL